MRKFISEKFSTPGQTFDDKFPTVGTTAFEKFQSLLGFRIPWAVFQIPKPRIPDSTRKSSLIPESGFPYITIVSNREGLVRVGLLWDKQHEVHIVWKSTLKLATFSSLVFIGTILNEWRDTAKKSQTSGRCVRQALHVHLLEIFKFLNSCILFNISPIDTKLQIFHNLNVLFLTMWVSWCLCHNKPTRIQPLSIWK